MGMLERRLLGPALPCPAAGCASVECGGAPCSPPSQIGLYESAAWKEIEAML